MMDRDEIRNVIHTFAHKKIELPIGEEAPYQRKLNLYGEKLLVPVLIECLGEPEDEVRRLSMSLLCELKDKAEPALTTMINALDDSCKHVRLTAAVAVAIFGEKAKAAVPILEIWTEKKDRFDYVTAIESILNIDPTRVNNLLPLLIEVLEMEDCMSRTHAIWVLGDLGKKTQDAVPELKQLLQDDDLVVRLEAAEALHKITGDPAYALTASDELLDDNDWLHRYVGAEHLRNMGVEARSSVPRLRWVTIEDEDEAVRGEAERALNAIVKEVADLN